MPIGGEFLSAELTAIKAEARPPCIIEANAQISTLCQQPLSAAPTTSADAEKVVWHRAVKNSMRAFARRGLWSTVAAGAAGAVFVAAKPWPALSAAIQLVVVNVTTVAEGYRVSKLLGTDVLNDKNEKIGSIDDIVIGKDRVLFVVLQVGGFLASAVISSPSPLKILFWTSPARKSCCQAP